MAEKIRDLKRKLRKAGFSMRHGKGSHTVWQHPRTPQAVVTIAGKDGDDAKPYMEKDVRKAIAQAGDRI